MKDAAYDPLAAETPYPLQEALGFRIVEWAEDYARVEMPIATVHQNRYGIPHGGVYATLIDAAAGYAGSWCPHPGRRRLAMTLSLNVNFVGRPTGETLVCEARRVGGGRKTFFAEATLKDDKGALVATGAATLRYRGNGGDPMGDPVE